MAIVTLMDAGDESSTWEEVEEDQWEVRDTTWAWYMAYMRRVPLVLFGKAACPLDGVDPKAAAHDLDACWKPSSVEPASRVAISLG